MQSRIRYRPKDTPATAPLKNYLENLSQPLGSSADLQPLIDFAKERAIVMLGEASHGTADFYTWRSEISKKLISEGGFKFIAVEGDWPDCYLINLYVKGHPGLSDNAEEVLRSFKRWPTWMWANEEARDLMEWLRSYNLDLAIEDRVGFYGLDVYSLWDSLHELISELESIDSKAFEAAQKVLECFHHLGASADDYVSTTALVDSNCEDHILRLLTKIREDALQTKVADEETKLSLAQNAFVIKNAEAYYRAMLQGGAASWNIRDMHMAETLERLHKHYGNGKAIVWAHNTHIGDARFTDMASVGLVNLGQLARESYGDREVALIGFASYEGSVIASRRWDAPLLRMSVPLARPHSWEEILHESGAEDKLMIFPQGHLPPEMEEPRGHRAIGVIYHPEDESGQYVPTILAKRYDALIYIDRSDALHPIETFRIEKSADLPETYPSGN